MPSGPQNIIYLCVERADESIQGTSPYSLEDSGRGESSLVIEPESLGEELQDRLCVSVNWGMHPKGG